MKLGFASPVSLQLLRSQVEGGEDLPPGYQFAPSADWILELMRRGHHVVLYTTAKEIDGPKTFRGNGITIRIARQRCGGAGRDLFAFEREQLKKMMVEDKCELIHAHWTYQFALAALASSIPTLVTIHDLPWNVLRHFRDFHRAARLIMAYQVALRGEHFTAVSKDAASHFARYLKPRAKISVIPNGLPDSFFRAGNPVRRNDGKAIRFATILQGWSRRKNGSAALKAFQIARREIPDARLQMIGLEYGVGEQAYRWAKQRNLHDGVTFTGSLPYHELPELIRSNVDVVVHPSLDEAFSMTALEGLALRKAFIAGEVTPGMHEMLAGGESGILVDVGSPSAIAEAMVRVARDSAYREQLAQRGFDRASTAYRLDTVMNQYEAQYSTVLQG